MIAICDCARAALGKVVEPRCRSQATQKGPIGGRVRSWRRLQVGVNTARSLEACS